MIDRYRTEMRKVTASIRKKLVWRGLTSSVVELIPSIGNAISLFYGGLLVVNGEIHYKNMFKYVIRVQSLEMPLKVFSTK